MLVNDLLLILLGLYLGNIFYNYIDDCNIINI